MKLIVWEYPWLLPLVFPLINVREMGKRIGDELKIQVVE
jgi:hypothetical protein